MSPVIVGLQARYKSDDPTAALEIASTDLTPLGTSTDTGTAIRNTDLVPTEQAIASFEGTHKGSFRVWARLLRPTSNTGEVTIALEWGEGDYVRHSRNDLEAVTFEADAHEGRWLLCDLGGVHISPEAGRWRLRILASSTVVGDELDVGQVLLFPAGAPGEPDRYGIASGVVQFETPSDFEARDEFNQTVGGGSDPLTGFTAPVGGVWAGAGDADDFVIEDSGHTAQRASSPPEGDPRFATANTPSLTDVAVQVDFKFSDVEAGVVIAGALARYADTSNYLTFVAATNQSGGPNTVLSLQGEDSGSSFVLGIQTGLPKLTPGVWYTIRLLADSAGQWAAWFFLRGAAAGAPVMVGRSPLLATGGDLASGKVGFSDQYSSGSGSVTRNYDNFLAFVPTTDAAIFAEHSLEWCHNRVEREPDGGGDLQRVSRFTGKYLTIPPAGLEGRESRIIVRGAGPELQDGVLFDDDLAALTATLHVAARGLVVP